jgi:purine-binding chemotaxis protein CheW
LITFYLGDFIFGIPAEKVVEINKDLEITPVPLADEFILGIMNLRGHIVTVMDLQKKIKLQGDLNYRLNLIIKKDNELLSFLVEKIGDILEVPVAKLEETPDRIEGLDRDYIENIYQLPDRLLLLLSVNKLFEN